MIKRPVKSFVLVVVQFVCIAYLLLTGAMVVNSWLLLAIQFSGIALGILSFAVMLKSKISIFPEVKGQSELIQAGPYRVIRHPMYAALILIFAPWVLNDYSSARGIVFALLCINLIFKIQFEEVLLQKHFPTFARYKQKTYRVVPFIW